MNRRTFLASLFAVPAGVALAYATKRPEYPLYSHRGDRTLLKMLNKSGITGLCSKPDLNKTYGGYTLSYLIARAKAGDTFSVIEKRNERLAEVARVRSGSVKYYDGFRWRAAP